LQREILGATRERMVREICEALESLSSEHQYCWCLKISTGLTLPHWISYPRWRGVVNKPKLMLVCTYRPVDVILSNSSFKGP